MAGRGLLGDVEPIRDERIRVFEDGKWNTAKEPLHHDRPTAGVGLAMSFGQTLLEQEPNVDIGFVPCAVGSTPIARWLPAADLYESAMTAATAAQKSGSVKGLLWHQGEHDSKKEADATHYAVHFSEMVAAVRQELGAPTLPVVVGGLGHFLAARPEFPFFRIVELTLQQLPETVPDCRFASSEGLQDKGDSLHFDAQSQREFGRRYATAYLELTRG